MFDTTRDLSCLRDALDHALVRVELYESAAGVYIHIYIHTYNVSRSRLDRNHSNHVVTEREERHKRVACCLENANCNVRALSLLPSVFAMRGYFIIALARIHGIHGYIDRAG